MESNNEQYKGIGGWLYLVIFGLVVGPIRIAYILFGIYFPMFSDGGWELLTTQGSEVYHHLWAPLLIFEIVGNVGTIVLALTTLWFLVKKSRHTPRLAIVWLVWNVAFVTIDFFAGDMIPMVAANPDPENFKELARSLIGACIWIPYFLVSKRVKATFVE